MSMSYIRAHYRVPAKRGALIRFEGKPAMVVGTSGPHLRARIDGQPGVVTLHPTWHVEWAKDEPAARKWSDPTGTEPDMEGEL